MSGKSDTSWKERRIVLILGLTGPDPVREAEARRLGWPVFRPPHALARFLSQCRPGILRHLLAADYAYVCLPEHPFMMEEQIGAWDIWNHDPGEIVCGETRGINTCVPLKIYTRAFVIHRFLLRLLFRGRFTEPQCQSIMVRYGRDVPPPSCRRACPPRGWSCSPSWPRTWIPRRSPSTICGSCLRNGI